VINRKSSGNSSHTGSYFLQMLSTGLSVFTPHTLVNAKIHEKVIKNVVLVPIYRFSPYKYTTNFYASLK